MKQFIFSFVLFLGFIMIGCQENSITDPNPAGSDLKANTNSSSQTSGTIPLDGILKVPGSFNTYYTVKGSVDFTEEISAPATDTPSDGFDVKVSLSANGTIDNSAASGQRIEHNLWYFSSKSQDQIFASIDGKYRIQKVYPIMGRTDGMVLVCQFFVTTSSVQLESRWLSFFVDDNSKSLSEK